MQQSKGCKVAGKEAMHGSWKNFVPECFERQYNEIHVL